MKSCVRHREREAKWWFKGAFLCTRCYNAARRAGDEARWVAASTKRGTVSHAVFVLKSDPSLKMVWDEKYQRWRGPKRKRGTAVCGVEVKHVIAGQNHGHDWDRTIEILKCLRCKYILEKGVKDV